MIESAQRRPSAAMAGRLARRWRLDRNPLRRASDRAETLVLALLVAAFLAGAPLAALACGAWAHAAAHRAELGQASRHRVTAVVLTATPDTGFGDATMVTQVRWTAPNGTAVTRDLPVVVGTSAGATLQVWITRDGQLTFHPMNDSQVADFTDLGEVSGAVGIALVLALAGVLARWSLYERRMAAWDADWHATGPRWTTRT